MLVTIKYNLFQENDIMVMIIKASGNRAPFDPNRLYRSLKRVGTDEPLIEAIVDELT